MLEKIGIKMQFIFYQCAVAGSWFFFIIDFCIDLVYVCYHLLPKYIPHHRFFDVVYEDIILPHGCFDEHASMT